MGAEVWREAREAAEQEAVRRALVPALRAGVAMAVRATLPVRVTY